MSQTSLPHVIDVDRTNFEREVIERSKDVPVLVDFWAAWCGPCRMLSPVLEKLAGEYGGTFILAKCDTEKEPDLAAAFGVRGIPAVFAVKDGRVADQFVGVVPEAQIRSLLDGLMPTEAETITREGEALEASDPAGAEAAFRRSLELVPTDPRPRIGLGRVLLAQGRVAEAQQIVDDLERRGYLEPEAETLKAELTLKEAAGEAGGLAEAKAAAEANPSDLHARFRLAEALAAAGQHAEALETGLDLVERDRHGVGEEARKLMLAVFQLLPADSPLVAEYRRKLSFVL